MSTLRIPTPLRAYTEGQKDISIEAATVEQALRALSARYPALNPHLYDERGTLRQYINLFVNDDNIRDLSGMDTSIQPGDQVMILPSIAGGYQC